MQVSCHFGRGNKCHEPWTTPGRACLKDGETISTSKVSHHPPYERSCLIKGEKEREREMKGEGEAG